MGLTREEMKILKILVDKNDALTGAEVLQQFVNEYSFKKKKSVGTKIYAYLAKLVKKGYVTSQKIGKSTFYKIANMKDIQREESNKFLNVLFESSLGNFVCCLSEQLSKDEIEKLKKEIEDL